MPRYRRAEYDTLGFTTGAIARIQVIGGTHAILLRETIVQPVQPTRAKSASRFFQPNQDDQVLRFVISEDNVFNDAKVKLRYFEEVLRGDVKAF